MGFEVAIIEFLQSGNFTFLDYLVYGITMLGDELFCIAVIGVLFWCIDKKFAYRMANVYFLSFASIEILKNSVARLRPFQSQPDTIRSIISDTSGYSFPSGHSHSIASLSTQVYLNYRKTDKARIILIIGIVATTLVMFSRMYLGQHYLTDVITGAAIGIGFAILFTYLFGFLKDKEEYLALGIIPLCLIVYLILACVGVADEFSDTIKVIGVYVAISGGYYIEKRYIGYDVKSDKFYKHIIKVVIGLVGILILKEGLKAIFPDDIIFLVGFLRYFIVGIYAIVVAPLIFKALKL